MSAATPGPTEQPPPYEGRTLVVDTSAWVVVRKALAEAVQPPWLGDFFQARASGQLRGHTVVKLELLHNARNPAAFLATEEQLDTITTLPITATASQGAVGALRDLAAGPGGDTYHRVGHGDALIAATAAERGFAVLHYDQDFERLGRVLGFDHVWIAPAGQFRLG